MATGWNAREIVRHFRGDWHGTYGLMAGPGHRPHDRSLKVWDAPDGSVRVHSFAGDDWRACREHLGLVDSDDWRDRRPEPAHPRPAAPPPAGPPARVRGLLRTACAVDLVPDAVAYLTSRHLWPLPAGCALRAHAAAEYWHSGEDGTPRLVGRFPALVAAVYDAAGALVTAHVTYLQAGRKLATHTPRKLLSPLAGRAGCAFRMLPAAGGTLGLAEGIETALAAHRRHGGPVWATLTAGLLAAFVLPPGIERLIIYADADPAGLKAAWSLRDRVRAIEMELRTPPPGCKDWADALALRHG